MESLWPVAAAVLALVLLGLLGYAVARRRRALAAPSRPALAPSPLATLERALAKTRALLGSRLEAAFARTSSGTGAVLSDLEEVLVSADVGARVASELVEGLRPRIGKSETD